MKDFPDVDIFNDDLHLVYLVVDVSITFWKQILRSVLHGLIFP